MKVERLYAQALERAGIELVEAKRTGGGHLKLTIARPESRTITASVIASMSPSDYRSTLNMVSTAKRLLREANDRWDGGTCH